MKKKSLLFLLALLSLSLGAQSTEKSSTLTFFPGTPEYVEALASNEGKLYFVYFSASWCMPCQWMEKNTFANPGLKEYVKENYLPLKVDLDDPDGKAYSQTYQVKVIPTILIFNAQGELLKKCEEALPAEKLMDVLQSFDQAANRLQVAVSLPSPTIEGVLPNAVNPMDLPPIVDIGEETFADASLSPQMPPVMAKPVITPTKEYGALPEDELILPPSLEQIDEPIESSKPVFGVQLGAFGQIENARRMISRFESVINYPLEMWPVQKDGREIYKVIAGRFSQVSEAKNLVDQLKRQSIKGFVQVLD